MNKEFIKSFISSIFGEPGEYMLEHIRDNQISFIEDVLKINESFECYYDIMKFAIANIFMCRALSDDIIKDYNDNKEICREFIDDYISFFDWIMFKKCSDADARKFIIIMDIEKPIINDWMLRFNKTI